jgi:NAD(P)-dependent dehydrogenase (short-subunit alcohol dehydrogenase family)
MTSKHGALVVVGSGPGIGQHVATVFAEHGFEKVILMSRNKDRLAKDADAVRLACSRAHVDEIVLDCAEAGSVRRALEAVDNSLGQTPLECVLYNAARLGPSHFFDFSAESLEADLQVGPASRALHIYAEYPAHARLTRYALLACTPSRTGPCPNSSKSQLSTRQRRRVS